MAGEGEPTLRQKTDEVLRNMPINASPETTVLVNLVKLLLEEMDRSELSTLKDKIATQTVVTDRLVEENKRLRDRLEDLEEQVDNNEQHDRNRNLLLRGVPEEETRRGPDGKVIPENTTKKFVDTLNEKYGPEHQLKMDDIARSHRLGPRKPNAQKPRPIIVRFALETKKLDVYRHKKNLKNTGKTLAENLTKYRSDLFRKACDLLDWRNVWTTEGRIHALHGRQKLHIKKFTDIPGYDAGDEPLF